MTLIVRLQPATLNAVTADAVASLLSALPARLFGLDLSNFRQLNSAFSLQILKHPAVQPVRSLTIRRQTNGEWISTAVVAAMAALPRLTALGIRTPIPFPELLRPLSASAHLTSLSFNDNSFHGPSCLQDVVRRRELVVETPWLYDRDWVSLVRSACFRDLTMLGLEHVVMSGMKGRMRLEPADLSTALSSLSSLRTLHLRSIFGIDERIPMLARPPLLTAVNVDLTSESAIADPSPRAIPSITAIDALLSDCDRIRSFVIRLFPRQHLLRSALEAALDRKRLSVMNMHLWEGRLIICS